MGLGGYKLRADVGAEDFVGICGSHQEQRTWLLVVQKGSKFLRWYPQTRRKQKFFGSYLVWDEEIGTWIRSGKAEHCTKRILTHNKDAQEYRGSTIEMKQKILDVYLEFIKNASDGTTSLFTSPPRSLSRATTAKTYLKLRVQNAISQCFVLDRLE